MKGFAGNSANNEGDVWLEMIQNDKSFCINLIEMGIFQLLFWIIFTSYGMMMSLFSFLVMWIDSYESIQLIPQNPNISIRVKQSKTFILT